MSGHLEYGEKELSYLRAADAKLAEVIDSVGMLRPPMDTDMYTSIVRNIVGQQISIPVYERIWRDMTSKFGPVPDPKDVVSAGKNYLRDAGLSERKAEYILDVSRGFIDGSIDPVSISGMDDDDALKALDSVRGIGPWTAEMVLLFCLKRPNVFSFGDLALIRGLRTLYGLEEVPRPLFEEFRKRFSPYCTVASLYIWEVGEGRFRGGSP